MPSGRDLVIGAMLIAAGAWFTFVWVHTPGGMPAFDIYSYYLPNMLYAAQRVAAGGAGLLWNPFQDCGQPSFGISSTGILYPFNLFFLVLNASSALRAVTVINFAVAGIGMYLLARELGTGRAAALCAALAFELGPATVDLSTWTPLVSSPYVWMPAAMLCCERLLRAPTVGSTVGLGAVLAVALLPGFPQCVVFTYQLIALRVLFELATRRLARPWRTLAAIGLGFALAPLLDAVQLVPGIEMAAQSVRGGSLSLAEIRGQAQLTWPQLLQNVGRRLDIFNPIVIVPCVVASASWLRTATRRRAIFYTLAGGLYFALAFGSATPLFELYLKLPFAALFREPPRFTWVTSFCVAVLTGFGADAIIRGRHAVPGWRRWIPVAVTSAALVGLYFLSPNRLFLVEWVLGGAVVAASVLASCGERWRPAAAALVILGTALQLLSYASPLFPPALTRLAVRQVPGRHLLPDDAVLFKRADLFAALRGELSGQERVHFIHENLDFALMPKTASLFQVHSLDDYEPQPSRRSGAYIVMMRAATQMTSLNQYYYPMAQNFRPWFRKRLLDLAAVRYLLVDGKIDNSSVISPPLSPHGASDDLEVKVYENKQALARARFVPTVDVVPDPNELLHRLAYGTDDLSQVALLEEPPPSGFRGVPGVPGDGTADIVVDEPERVVVHVRAPARGFLHLADQWFIGWRATVNGVPVPILRANYLFRAVEVPAGESTVEFRYEPLSVRIGAAITTTALIAVAVAALVARRRQRGHARGAEGPNRVDAVRQ
jgi:hypothetical protein